MNPSYLMVNLLFGSYCLFLCPTNRMSASYINIIITYWLFPFPISSFIIHSSYSFTSFSKSISLTISICFRINLSYSAISTMNSSTFFGALLYLTGALLISLYICDSMSILCYDEIWDILNFFLLSM